MENQPYNTSLQKGDPIQLINHLPIALTNTIYEFFTSTLTSIPKEALLGGIIQPCEDKYRASFILAR
jgi:hypothetical protein